MAAKLGWQNIERKRSLSSGPELAAVEPEPAATNAITASPLAAAVMLHTHHAGEARRRRVARRSSSMGGGSGSSGDDDVKVDRSGLGTRRHLLRRAIPPATPRRPRARVSNKGPARGVHEYVKRAARPHGYSRARARPQLCGIHLVYSRSTAVAIIWRAHRRLVRVRVA